MKYKELGKTGLKVSVVSFGGIPIQRVDKEQGKEIIVRAEELGINFIDTARGYGVSEEYIGYALDGRRDKWIIASKSMTRTKDGIMSDVKTTLNNLKTDYIDLYQLHNVKTQDDFDKVLAPDGAYAGLKELKDQGIIKHIGVTSHSLDILKLLIETGKFETIMYPYSIVENQGEEVFKRAKELNIGVIAMKPMAGGNLTDSYLPLRFIANKDFVDVAIPGMGSVDEVEKNVKAVENVTPLTEDELKQISEVAGKLSGKFCRRCGYCGPCPKGIDIPGIFVLNAYVENYDLKDWAVGRYNGMAAHCEDCVKCGACEKRCPYDLPIRQMLEDIKGNFK